MNTKLNRNPNWLELAREANWSVEELAKQCGISSRTLYRYFIRRFGKHPRKWIGGQRQIEAIAMLKDGFSVKEVASNVLKHFRGSSNAIGENLPPKLPQRIQPRQMSDKVMKCPI